jgi:hypothetical protein
LRGADPVDFPFEAELAKTFPWPLTTPLVAGDVQTYSLRGSGSVVTRGRRRLLVRPTDRAGATFEIESVRLVTRREHLGEVTSGLSWQGLAEVYREALVARAPETIRFRVRLPSRPRLELAVGTTEEWPVHFRVSAQNGADETTLTERTVTVADRWEQLTVDLERFGGREVTLSLGLSADKPGRLGLWGAPVVRNVNPRGAGGDKRKPAQGVILVWADALRRDHLDAYGYSRPTAPAVKRLAAEGVLFRDCVSQGAWTKVVGPSLFTSLYPTTHGVANVSDRLPSSATTLAEVFRDAGFATVGLTSISFVGNTLWADPAGREAYEQQRRAVRPHIAHPNMRRFNVPTRDELVQAGVNPEAYAAYERDWYDGAIREMDGEIGRLRERLSDLGLTGRVVLAFMSDHGYEFLEHGRMFVGHSVYGELTNVPLIVWGPGIISAGKVVEPTVQLVDVMPTLVELAGLQPPSGIQGRSLAAAVREGPSAGRLDPRPAIAEKTAGGATQGADTRSVALFRAVEADP